MYICNCLPDGKGTGSNCNAILFGQGPDNPGKSVQPAEGANPYMLALAFRPLLSVAK